MSTSTKLDLNPPLSISCKAIAALRALFFCCGIWILNGVIDLGTSPLALFAAATLGIVVATHYSRGILTDFAFIVLLVLLFVGVDLSFALGDAFIPALTSSPFSLYKFQTHVNLFTLVFAIAATSTWFFWRHRYAVTLETILICGLMLYVLSGHQYLHLDRPKILGSFAWALGLEPLSVFILVGSALLISTVLYLYFASFSSGTLDRTGIKVIEQRGGPASALSIGTWLILAILLSLSAFSVYQFFKPQLGTMLTNGVGSTSKEGMSPLGFHSALGSTNQPAGLVRLEGDYSQNPFSPMLYMRESALSGFNGHEMTFAGKAYDSDLPGVSPRDSFTGKEDAELHPRVPLIQSIYPLAEQDFAYAVDYPVSIVQLKNPNPGRFKAAYRAYSVAPAYKLSELEEAPVGDPRWAPDIKAHYLTQHPDKRYADLAEEITKDAKYPIQKVFAITNYLSRTAIYTLSPNHDVEPNQDPVAPFLFGDHRGYCVHFAHAIVYMTRALGIPARIGTGYLTDLSQAKDGHILLRMSDRHAWAEVFITDVGWVPFDVQPDQVESHAETQVDSKLLEELMGMLDPGEEILPKDTVKNEANVEEQSKFQIPSLNTLIIPLACVILFLIFCKAFIMHGYKFATSSRSQLRAAQRAVMARLIDLGYQREPGETRSIFTERIKRELNISLDELTKLSLLAKYSRPDTEISKTNIIDSLESSKSGFRQIKWWQKLLVLLNPRSVITWLGGGRW